MKIGVIRKLVNDCDTDRLKALASKIENGEDISTDQVGGDDAGDQLSNLLAALEIKEKSAANGTDIKDELRAFMGRVRDTIN